MYDRLKFLRKNLGLTQAELAEKLNIGQTYLSEIERGNRNPAPQFFLSLAMLNINLNWLFTGEGSMFTEKSVQAETELFDFDLLNSIVKELPSRRQKRVLEYAEDQRDISKILSEQDNPEITPK